MDVDENEYTCANVNLNTSASIHVNMKADRTAFANTDVHVNAIINVRR